MRIGHLMSEALRERVVVLSPWVFVVRRVNSDDLRRVGWAELEGASDAVVARRQADDDRKIEQAKRVASNPKSVAKLEADRTALRQRQAEMELQRMLGSASGQRAWLERCDAYIRACVVSAGRIRLDREPAKGADGDPLPIELFDLADLPSVAEAVDGSDAYTDPMTFVADQSQHDPEQGRVWIHVLSERQRVTLGSTLLQLQGVAPELAAFRALAEHAAPTAQARKGVRRAS